jgi:hypothetical protein
MTQEDTVRSRFTIVAFAALAMSSVSARPSAAQQREPRRPACNDSRQPYFDFQVDRPARFLRAPHRMARPAGLWAQDTVRVQFLLDRSGHAVDSTIRVFHAADSAIAVRVRTAVLHWQFAPAWQADCPVWQVVNTAVRLG